jgi:spore coat protein A, manganese oxidase
MTISRRSFLRDGTRAAAVLATGPAFWGRMCSRDTVSSGTASRDASPDGLGNTCRSPVASSVPPPVRPPLHPDSFARFVDPLPIPRVLEPGELRPDPFDPARRIPYYRIPMREAESRVHRDLPPTRFWSYGGEVPGPTVETRAGHGVLIEWVNELPDRHPLPIDHSLHGAHADLPEVRTVVHVHGAKTPPESDGYPEEWFTRGHSAIYHYPCHQDATMLWYHDHTMGIERLNQYAGLFGAFMIRDEIEEALNLPRGRYEAPLVLCDRLLYADAQLRYPTSGDPDAPWVSEVYGDALLVNGKLFPFLDVEPRRYRFRVLNAANSRFYDLSLSNGQTFHQIGTDQGLLSAPVPLTRLLLGPAERADLIVDFSAAAGEKVALKNQAAEMMQFRVAPSGGKSEPLPSRLRPIKKLLETAAVKTRSLTLNEYHDRQLRRMVMLLNGTYWHLPVTEKPQLDTIEIWNFINLTEDAHPIHLHLVRFQILDRQLFDADEYLISGTMRRIGAPLPPAPAEAGWKDTVRVDAGTITRIITRFEGYAGRYVWHCHVLEHAANEMMRPFEVVAG